MSVRVGGRGADLLIEGDEADVAVVERILKDYSQLFNEGRTPSANELREAFKRIADDRTASLRELLTGQKRINPAGRKQVTARGPNQKRYLEAIENHDIVFGIGPAGTGKTYLAVAMAVQYLMAKRVNRIILARPAVEAGEKLGFLPGDMREKVDPYLRPLYDALNDMLPGDQVVKRMTSGEIEVAPLAFMRGRTLAHSFVILDEAQNTTPMQMKMFLTRLGQGSRMAITGDLSQIDLPSGTKSGLKDALEAVEGIQGIGVARFSEVDVVRHPLVARIVGAYDARDKKAAGKG